MGTDVQRRQALDGISALGEIRGPAFPHHVPEERAQRGLRSPKTGSLGIALVSG